MTADVRSISGSFAGIVLAAGGATALSMRLAHPEQIGWGVFGGLVLAFLTAGLGPALVLRWWGEVPPSPGRDGWVLPNLAFAVVNGLLTSLSRDSEFAGEALSWLLLVSLSVMALTPLVAAVRCAGGGVSFRLLASGWGAFALVLWIATLSPAWERDDGLGTGFFIAFWAMALGLYTAEVLGLAVLSAYIARRRRWRRAAG